MLILYSIPGSSAISVQIALEWAALPYTVKIMQPGENRLPAYLAINPLGSVPALRLDDGQVLTEAAALLTWIDTMRPEAFGALQRDPVGTARLSECLSFFTSELQPAFGPHFNPRRFSPDPAHHDTLREETYARIDYLLAHVAAKLEGPFLFGDQRSVADPYLYVICGWTEETPINLGDFSGLAAFKARMDIDPGVLAAMARYTAAH